MNNNSHIHIENHVSVHQSGHDYAAANAGCAGLAALGTLVGLGALGFGLYLVAEPTFEMVLDVAYGLGDAIGAMATGALDILHATGHLLKMVAMPILWTIGYGCLGLVGVALLSAVYSRLQEWRQDRIEAIRVIEQPQPAKILVLVANPEQAQEAIKLLPDNVSVEFIQMPKKKAVEYA